MGQFTTVNGGMQSGYRYQLVVPSGRNFDPVFQPDLTPKQMLELGTSKENPGRTNDRSCRCNAMPQRAIWRLGAGDQRPKNSHRRRITGIGTPISQSKRPRPHLVSSKSESHQEPCASASAAEIHYVDDYEAGHDQAGSCQENIAYGRPALCATRFHCGFDDASIFHLCHVFFHCCC